jgi:hypothetical protein
VWAIGYEIVASLILGSIFISYMKYVSKSNNSSTSTGHKMPMKKSLRDLNG